MINQISQNENTQNQFPDSIRKKQIDDVCSNHQSASAFFSTEYCRYGSMALSSALRFSYMQVRQPLPDIQKRFAHSIHTTSERFIRLRHIRYHHRDKTAADSRLHAI